MAGAGLSPAPRPVELGGVRHGAPYGLPPIGRAATPRVPLVAHEAARPEDPVHALLVARAPERQVVAQRHVGARVVAALGARVAVEKGADRRAVFRGEHPLDELIVGEVAGRCLPAGITLGLGERRLGRGRLGLDPGPVGPRHHLGVRRHRAVPLVDVARHGEVAVVVVHLHGPAPAPQGALGLAPAEDQVQAVAGGRDLRVRARLLHHPAVLLLEHAAADHVVQVEPRVGAVGPEDEPHARAAQPPRGGHGGLEGRPGGGVRALRHAPRPRVYGHLRAPAVALGEPPAHPARLRLELGGHPV